MAHAGIRSRFRLADKDGTLTDVSTYLDNVAGSSDQEWLDGTTFQPDAESPLKDEIPGFATKSKSLSGKWTVNSEVFFTGIEGKQNLAYEETPAEGDGVGLVITGVCSCGSYSGPQYDVNGVVTFTAELRITTRQVLVGSPGSPI